MALECEKLYLDPLNDWETPFEAVVTDVVAWDNQAALQLNRTFFYPESGGQLGDGGQLTLGNQTITVVDTQIDEAGTIYHLIDQPTQAGWCRQTVKAQVDPARRRDMMRAHSGQHLLSAAFFHVAGVETKSARLGTRTISVDLESDDVHSTTLNEAAAQANQWVLAGHPIRVHNPSPAALAAMPLRRPPKVTENIRVVEIEGVDWTPCGGTHCSNTGEIGALHILAKERIKKLTRVHFHCGLRTLDYLRHSENLLQQAATHLQCSAGELPDQVQRLRDESRALRQDLGKLRAEAARFEADRLLAAHAVAASGTTVISAVAEDIDGARKLAEHLVTRDDVVAAVRTRVAEEGFVRVVVARGASAQFDAGQWFRNAGKSLGARGGGRPEKAEGKCPEGANFDDAFSDIG